MRMGQALRRSRECIMSRAYVSGAGGGGGELADDDAAAVAAVVDTGH